MLKAVMFVYNSVSFFSHIIEPNFEMADKELLNNFLTAIDAFAKDIYKSNLNSINLGNYTLMLSKVPLQNETGENFTIICFVDKDENQNKIREYIESFQHGFLRIFSPQDIIAWDGNILKFLSFKKIINRILNLPPGHSLADINIEPEMQKRYQVNESVLFGVVDQYQEILDSYTYSKESELSISMPDIIARISGNISIDTHRWEGIIPFLDEHQIALILLVRTNDPRIVSHFLDSSPLFLVIAYTVPEEFQVDFSRSAGIISQLIQNNCLNVLNNKYLDSWPLIFEQIKIQLNNHLIESSPIRRVDTVDKDIGTLSDFGKIKNADTLCFALITGTPVAIVGGSPNFARRIMHQCLFFTIHRSMSILEFPSDPVELGKADIVLITEKESKNYKNYIQVDLEKMQVKGGSPNKYCERILKDIMAIQESDLILLYLKRKINYLLSKATMLRNLSWDTKIDMKTITEIKAGLDPEAEMIVIKLAEGRNSILQNLVDFMSKNIPLKSLIVDDNFVKFNDEKVVVNTNLSREKNIEYMVKFSKMGKMLLGPRVMDAFMKK
jgi:hypothetical protein